MTTTTQPIQTAVPSSEAARTLTVHDRCDRCRAQAWHRATLASTGQTLDFCAHHAAEHMDALLLQCSRWIDESRFLLPGPTG